MYIDTKLDPNNTTGRSIAHNGLYADGGAVINVTGNTYINDHIATGTHEGYDNEYEIDTKGNVNTISKNDAVSAKHGGGSTVNINANEDGTILNPENTVQIYGNLDAKKGTIRVGFSGKDSYWYGAGVGLINYNEATQTYGDVRDDSRLQVTLADGAKWVPDIMLRGKDAQGLDTRSNYLSAITLDKGGIIDTHAYNVHTEDKDTVNNLVLYNLKSNEGTFVMDASGAKVNNAYRNAGTDFFTIKDGSGLVYVQPADISALKGVSLIIQSALPMPLQALLLKRLLNLRIFPMGPCLIIRQSLIRILCLNGLGLTAMTGILSIILKIRRIISRFL